MQITRDWIDKNKTVTGGWNKEQLRILNIGWPPAKKWKRKLIGRHITEEQAQQCVDAGKRPDDQERLQRKLDRKARRREQMRQIRVSKLSIKKRDKIIQIRKSSPVTVTKYPDGKPHLQDVGSDEFLQTYEWRRVRMQVLKKYGARCQCCGVTPDNGAKIHVDHIKPRRLFPQLALDPSNLQVLCHECNHGKGNWDMTDWRVKSEAK